MLKIINVIKVNVYYNAFKIKILLFKNFRILCFYMLIFSLVVMLLSEINLYIIITSCKLIN